MSALEALTFIFNTAEPNKQVLFTRTKERTCPKKESRIAMV